MNQKYKAKVLSASLILGMLCGCGKNVPDQSETQQNVIQYYYDFGNVQKEEWASDVSKLDITDDTLLIGTFVEYDNDIIEELNKDLKKIGAATNFVFVRIPDDYQTDGKIADFVEYMGEKHVALDVYPAWQSDIPYLSEKDQMYDISDYLKSDEGKDVWNAVDDVFWEYTQYYGKYYGIGIARENNSCWIVNKELLDKYNITEEELAKPLDQLEPVLKKVKETGDNVIPFLYNSDIFSYIPIATPDGRVKVGYWIDNYTGTVTNLFDTDEMYNLVKTLNEYSEKGYTQYGDIETQNNFFMGMSYSRIPVMRKDKSDIWTNQNVELINIPYYSETQYDFSILMNIIPSWSENKQKALYFLNRVFTDKDISELLLYGISGREYTAENETYEITDDFNDSRYMDTSFGNLEICTPMEPFSDQQGGFISEGYEMSDKDRSTRGFVFESSAVENEIQKVMNIWNDQNNLDTLFSFDKYKKNGYSDWQSYYEKFNADLKNAGIDKIVDEMNHQIAEYAAKKIRLNYKNGGLHEKCKNKKSIIRRVDRGYAFRLFGR